MIFLCCLNKQQLLKDFVMGWPTKNLPVVNETTIKNTVDAMSNSKLYKNGYQYIFLENDIFAQTRDTNQQLQLNHEQFPSGMVTLIEYIHNQGFKVAFMLTSGDYTDQSKVGSYGFEENDIQQLHDLNIDLIGYGYEKNNISRQEQAPNIGTFEFCSQSYSIYDAKLLDGARKNYSTRMIENVRKDKGSVQYTFSYDGSCSDGNALFLNISDTTGQKVFIYQVNNKQKHLFVNKIATNSHRWKDSIRIELPIDFDDLIQGQNNILQIELYDDVELFSQYSIHQFLYIANSNAIYKDIILRVADGGDSKSWNWVQPLAHMYQRNKNSIKQVGDILKVYLQNVHESLNPPNFNFQKEILFINLTTDNTILELQLNVLAMLRSPIIFSENVFNVIRRYQDLLTNPELLYIYKDQTNKPMKFVQQQPQQFDVIARQLKDFHISFFVINTNGNNFQKVSINLKELGGQVFEEDEERTRWENADRYWCKNVWMDETYQRQDSFKFLVPPTASGLFKCYAD